MTSARFDSIVQNLINDWNFESLLKFFKANAVKNSKQLEFCVYLADIGLLDELHNFISENGLYNLRIVANDHENTYEKRDNAKLLLNIYETEMLGVFERQPAGAQSIDADLLRLAQYSDISILINYITKKSDIIFQSDQSPKTLMYLTYAINKILQAQTDDSLVKLLLNHLDNFKKISALRKGYITKLLSTNLLLNTNLITFPQIGHNKLQTLLGIIYGQINKYKGAALLYASISDAVRTELKVPSKSRVLGSDIAPRVAVCLSGMYRCGNLPLESLYENIVEPLKADVFFHSWKEMQTWPGLGGAGDEWLLRIFNKEIFNKCPIPLRSKKNFKEKFPRTFGLLDTPSHSPFEPDILPKNIKFKKIQLDDAEAVFKEQNIDEVRFSSLGSLNQAKMLYGIYKASELAVNYERDNGFRYDYIIRCRPDVGLYNKLSFSELERLKTQEIAMEFNKMVGAQDQFWYGQRSPALSMASLWAASVENHCLSPFSGHPLMRAHGLFLGWMTHNRLQPVHTPIRRDMAMATSNAVPPNVSEALAEDFKKEAFDLSQNQEILDFFTALLGFNKK